VCVGIAHLTYLRSNDVNDHIVFNHSILPVKRTGILMNMRRSDEEVPGVLGSCVRVHADERLEQGQHQLRILSEMRSFKFLGESSDVSPAFGAFLDIFHQQLCNKLGHSKSSFSEQWFCPSMARASRRRPLTRSREQEP
jgi:hypothetical protein